MEIKYNIFNRKKKSKEKKAQLYQKKFN